MRQHVYHGLPLQALESHFTELVSCAHSVCLFTDGGASQLTQIWIKQRTGQPEPEIMDSRSQGHAIPALRALDRVREKIHPVLQICEVRTIAADELWLSPCYRQHSVSIHFTWVADTAAVSPVVAPVEAQLAPFGARPHWGKIFTSSPKMLRLPDFRDLVREPGSTGKFGNAFTRRHLALHA